MRVSKIYVSTVLFPIPRNSIHYAQLFGNNVVYSKNGFVFLWILGSRFTNLNPGYFLSDSRFSKNPRIKDLKSLKKISLPLAIIRGLFITIFQSLKAPPRGRTYPTMSQMSGIPMLDFSKPPMAGSASRQGSAIWDPGIPDPGFSKPIPNPNPRYHLFKTNPKS